MRKNITAKSKAKGFSIIEIMIVIVILGVLTVIAFSSYRNYILKSKRKEAIADIMTWQQDLGRQYSLNNGAFRIDSSDTVTTDKTESGSCSTAGDYTSGGSSVAYKFTVSLTKKRQAYSIIAEPCGGQTDDKCGFLQLDNTGLRTVKEKGASSFSINRDCF